MGSQTGLQGAGNNTLVEMGPDHKEVPLGVTPPNSITHNRIRTNSKIL